MFFFWCNACRAQSCYQVSLHLLCILEDTKDWEYFRVNNVPVAKGCLYALRGLVWSNHMPYYRDAILRSRISEEIQVNNIRQFKPQIGLKITVKYQIKIAIFFLFLRFLFCFWYRVLKNYAFLQSNISRPLQTWETFWMLISLDRGCWAMAWNRRCSSLIR